MEGAQEFGYNQLMTTAAAEKQRYHIKNENHSENKEQQHFAVEDLLDFSNNDDDLDHIHDDYVLNDFVEDNHRHLPENVDNVDADVGITATATTTATGGNSADSSSITVVGRCSAENGVVLEDPKFDNELCVPYDDLAELEWLSNFVEESFSSEDLQKLQFISGQSSGQKSSSSSQTRPTSLSDDTHPLYHHQPDLITAATDYSNNNNNSSNPTTPTQATSHSNPIIFNPELTVPARARSKRSRAAAPCNWSSHLLLVSPTTLPLDPAEMLPTPNVVTGAPRPNTNKSAGPKKKGAGTGVSDTTATAATTTTTTTTTLGSSGEGRKCLHCATDKTPQWRTGPMGPKTLCNACGVRYKSGRLVPEYRPASSPTFVLTKHSNSHRKVMELRRQKEMMRQQCQNQQVAMMEEEEEELGSYGGGMVFDVTNGDDYLIHQHVGPDYRQLI